MARLAKASEPRRIGQRPSRLTEVAEVDEAVYERPNRSPAARKRSLFVCNKMAAYAVPKREALWVHK